MSAFEDHLSGAAIIATYIGLCVSGQVIADPSVRSVLRLTADPVVQACDVVREQFQPTPKEPETAERTYSFRRDDYATYTVTHELVEASTSLPHPLSRP